MTKSGNDTSLLEIIGTHCWIDYVFFNGLAGIKEGTSLARFGELVFVFIVGFDVEIFNPSTKSQMRNGCEYILSFKLSKLTTYKLSVPKKKTHEDGLADGLEVLLRSFGGFAICQKTNKTCLKS